MCVRVLEGGGGEDRERTGTVMQSWRLDGRTAIAGPTCVDELDSSRERARRGCKKLCEVYSEHLEHKSGVQHRVPHSGRHHSPPPSQPLPCPSLPLPKLQLRSQL